MMLCENRVMNCGYKLVVDAVCKQIPELCGKIVCMKVYVDRDIMFVRHFVT